MIHADTRKYNQGLDAAERKICEVLAKEIDRGLPEAENKVWHAHPVWFLDGNPIVGYSKLKNRVRLLFWSGQSFEEKGLAKEGSFKAAEVRYTAADQVNTKGSRAVAGEGTRHPVGLQEHRQTQGRTGALEVATRTPPGRVRDQSPAAAQ